MSMNNFQSTITVAEAMSLTEYHHASSGNPPLNDFWTSDLTFERFRECTGQMPGYDLLGMHRQDYGPLIMPVAPGSGLGGGCDALLFDMLAGSHGQHLAETNYPNSGSELRFGLATASGVAYTPRYDIPNEKESLFSSADTCAQGFADLTNFVGYYPTTAEAIDSGSTPPRSGINTSSGSIPVALHEQQQSLTHEGTVPVSKLLGVDHGILQAQYEDSEQIAVAALFEDHAHVPLVGALPELDGIYQENGSGENSLQPTSDPFPKVLMSQSSNSSSKPSSNGMSSLPDQRTATVHPHPQTTSGPSSSRRVRVTRPALKRPENLQASAVEVQRPLCPTQQTKPSTYDREFCERPPQSFADSSGALALNAKANVDEVANDDVIGGTTDRHMSPKRRRTRLSLDREAELQRMTHITVERNRRRQMNDHLATLKALMPVAYVQKNDQASIVGAAVEFVKELQVLLESLQSMKRRRSYAGILSHGKRKSNDGGPPNASQLIVTSIGATAASPIIICPTASESLEGPRLGPVPPLKPVTMSPTSGQLFRIPVLPGPSVAELKAECTSVAATIEVKVAGNDAVVNAVTQWRPRQLLKVIGAMEGLYMTIMHISVTTTKGTVFYTFTTQLEPDCRMTADQLAAALQQTFKLLHYTNCDALAGEGMCNR